MKKLAVTGNIACGKNLVGQILLELNCPVIDSDVIVHQLLSSKNETTDKLVEIVKPISIVAENYKDNQTTSYINRRALGELVFNDSQLKSEVEKLIHPVCFQRIDSFFSSEALKGAKVAANLIPLLFETGTEDQYDEVWLVFCPREIQLERLKLRNPELKEEELIKRIDSQLSQEDKMKKANFIIDNSSSRECAKEQVIIAWQKLLEQK